MTARWIPLALLLLVACRSPRLVDTPRPKIEDTPTAAREAPPEAPTPARIHRIEYYEISKG